MHPIGRGAERAPGVGLGSRQDYQERKISIASLFFLVPVVRFEPLTFCVAKIVTGREMSEVKMCLHIFASEWKSERRER
jgi:hypothetical protein